MRVCWIPFVKLHPWNDFWITLILLHRWCPWCGWHFPCVVCDFPGHLFALTYISTSFLDIHLLSRYSMCLRPLREAIIYISGCPKYESDLNFNEIKRRKTYKLRFQLCIRPIYFPCRFCILAVLALPLNWTVTPVYFKEKISTFLLLAGISYSQMTLVRKYFGREKIAQRKCSGGATYRRPILFGERRLGWGFLANVIWNMSGMGKSGIVCIKRQPKTKKKRVNRAYWAKNLIFQLFP